MIKVRIESTAFTPNEMERVKVVSRCVESILKAKQKNLAVELLGKMEPVSAYEYGIALRLL